MILCKSSHLIRLKHGYRLGKTAQPAPLLLVHGLIGAHHPLSDRGAAANIDSNRTQAEIERIARFSRTDGSQILGIFCADTRSTDI